MPASVHRVVWHTGSRRMKKKKYCQFSIGGLLALTVIAATLVSFRDGLTSERSLHAIWVASFLFSY